MIYYVAHPLGTGEARVANLARVKRWLAWLLKKYPEDAFCLPWVAYAEALPDEPAAHKRGLQDDLKILLTCDAVLLCGGEISPGMREEIRHFRTYKCNLGQGFKDLTSLGPEPPND